MMTFQDFKRIIDTIGKTCINLEMYNWGEPFLNRDIFKMIDYATRKYNVYTRISSNLNLSNEEFYKELVLSGLNSLTISLDGASRDTYSKYRVNGSFDRVIDNIRLIVNYKKKFGRIEPKLVWQFLVFRHNEHEIEIAKIMAKDLSVNEIVFLRPHIPQELKDWDSSIKRFSNFLCSETGDKNNNNNTPGKKINKKCNWPYSSIAINANLSVSPCCAVAKEEDDFGYFSDDRFSDAWNTEKFKFAREYVSRNMIIKDSDNVCARCEMKGSINFAPSFSQVLYYLIPPLRMLYMNLNKFKVSSF
jgi:MoaA/NifB/PqqE/SkfB family radical SAM enzyme